MLPVKLDTIRLFLHILAATVWVGGQLTLAGLVPKLRAAGPDVPKVAARAFNRIAWPAFAVLILTGFWNIASVDRPFKGAYGVTLGVKMLVVAISGMSAYLHTRSKRPIELALWGSVAGTAALIALFLGILLVTS